MAEEPPDTVQTEARMTEATRYPSANYIYAGAVLGFVGGIVGSYALGACEAYNRGASLAGCAASGAVYTVLLFHPATWLGTAAGAAIGGLAYVVKRSLRGKTPTVRPRVA